MAELAREDAPAAGEPSPRIVRGTGAASAPLELASSDDEAPPRGTPAAAGSIVQSSLILVPSSFHVLYDVRRLSSNSVNRKNVSPGAQKSKKRREVLLGISERFKTPSNPGCQNQNLKSVLEPFTARLTN